MIRIFLLVAAIVGFHRPGIAVEIVTECPSINEQGRDLVARKLLPDTLPLKPVRVESRELPQPFFGTETDWHFWVKGMEPITNAAFSCIYANRSELYVPIVGMLLYCRALILSPSMQDHQISLRCTSETDPGLLLNK
jgi:hypothetical protein